MKLELLVVLAVAALVPSLAEGRLVSKCELETKLAEAADQFNLTEKIMAKGFKLVDILAKIICSLDLKSGLNTSLVTNIVLAEAVQHNTPLQNINLRKARHVQAKGEERRPITTERPEKISKSKQKPQPKGKSWENKPKHPARDAQAMENEVNPKPTGKPKVVSPKPTGKSEVVKPISTGKSEVVNPKSIGIPKVLNPKPTGKSEVVNPKSIGIPKVLNPKPTEKPKVVSPKTTGNPWVVNPKSTGKPKVVSPKTTGKPRLVDPKPTGKLEVVKSKPIGKPEVVPSKRTGKPDVVPPKSTGKPEVMPLKHTGMLRVVNPKPTGKPEVVPPKSTGTHEVVPPKSKGKHEGVPTKSAGKPQVVNPKPTGKSKVMPLKHRGMFKVVNPKPTGKSQVVNPKPTGKHEIINPEPTEKPQVVNLKHKLKPEGVTPKPTGKPKGGKKSEAGESADYKEEQVFGSREEFLDCVKEEEQDIPFVPVKPLHIKLFGLFQLSDHLTCISSNTTYSLNLCNTTCSSFLDEDISDDIACFAKSRAWMKAMKFPWKCAKLQSSVYFQCNQPLSNTTSI
uniref:Glycosyl hydrolases family 22 (GH22) domain-containing protein n=1 Tax=Esox lucius TaxID=8010 RepID=A0AAY5KE63_ESOLU